jgi:ribonucleoside-diphosphate reductase alpha chain
MNNIQVTKRNGQREDFDVKKIKRMMEFACEGYDVDPIKLESQTSVDFFDGIKTLQIQQAFIQGTNALVTLQEPEWTLVGGRLEMMSIWSDVEFERGYKYNEIPFSEFVSKQIEKGIYSNQYLNCYSDSELNSIGELIDPSYDLVYDLAASRLWRTRYLLKNELPQEALLVSALILASQELPENRITFATEVFYQLRERKISLATPMLGNSRKPSGSASSCFINAIDDSLLEDGGIMKVLTDIAAISKNGGGVGTYISKVRANGSWIKGEKGLAKGVIPWIKMINATAIAVDQLGKRQGAVTVALDVWHYDIEEFLQLRTENGDERRKARDIFPQVVIPNLFIDKAVNDEYWYLVCPYEIKNYFDVDITELWGEEFNNFYINYLIPAAESGELELAKKVSAKHLLTEIAKISVETGLPYITFKDNVNYHNPNKDSGIIPCFNLCTESSSVVKPHTETHVCSLVSVNWANCLTAEDLIRATKVSVRILDNAINVTTSPVPSAHTHNQKYRVIGIGDMGVADHMAYHSLKYDSKEGLNYINQMFDKVALAAFEESVELAKERGTFGAYDKSEFPKGIILGKPQSWFEQNSVVPEQWEKLFSDIQKYGIRNSQLKAIAPNTSTSLLQGCSPTALPVFNKSYQSRGVTVMPPYIKEKFWGYKEYRRYEQDKIIDFVATIQKWVDTGISFEFIYDLNEERNNGRYIISNIIKAAYSGIKAIYYVRSITKDRGMSEKVECDVCAN